MFISPGLKTKGIIRAALFASALLLFGVALAYLGWQGWSIGEIVVRAKGKEPFLATAVGPTSTTFQIQVWTFMLLGGAAIVLSLASILSLLLASTQRREQILLRLARQNPGARGQSVPGWFVALVLVLLLGVFVYAAGRGA